MLNYKNDSLLLKKETARDIIKNKRDLLFLDKKEQILNLYSAFVKKEDFSKTDKINQPLQKTVYTKVSKKLSNIIKYFDQKEYLSKKIEEYILRRTNIRNAKIRWFKTQTFPFIILRIIGKDNKELSKFINEIEYFTDFLHKSKFICPKNIDELLTPKNVYLAGCSLGDGHIEKNGCRWVLVDGSSKKERLTQSREFIERLSKIIEKMGCNPKITQKETKIILKINNKLLCRFLNFFFDLPFGKKKEVVLGKPLILKHNKEIKKYFWRGCYDTDGSVIKEGAIDLCSSDKNLLTECHNYLKTLKINSRIRNRSTVINLLSLKKFTEIGFSHPRKQKELLDILKRNPKHKETTVKNQNGPDKEMIRIMPLLRYDSNYRIRVSLRRLKESEFDEEMIKKILKRRFGCELKKGNRLLYFKSKKVCEYLKTYTIQETYWKAINSEEETKLLKEWNEVWG